MPRKAIFIFEGCLFLVVLTQAKKNSSKTLYELKFCCIEKYPDTVVYRKILEKEYYKTRTAPEDAVP